MRFSRFQSSMFRSRKKLLKITARRLEVISWGWRGYGWGRGFLLIATGKTHGIASMKPLPAHIQLGHK